MIRKVPIEVPGPKVPPITVSPVIVPFPFKKVPERVVKGEMIEPFRVNIPDETVVAPLYVLFPETINCPAPILFNDPVPDIWPA